MPLLPELFQTGGVDPDTGILWDGAFEDPTGNSFCPTGQGGGVDPTCSPTKSSQTIKQRRSALYDKYSARIDADVTGPRGLDKDKAEQHKKEIKSVLGRMPDKALSRLEENLETIEVCSSTKEVAQSWWEASGKTTKVPKKYQDETAGYYDYQKKSLSLDGPITHAGGQASPIVRDSEGILAHEMTHAIAGMIGHDKGEDWFSIYRDEIKKKPDKNYSPLSRRADDDQYEAFAEFGRLIYGPRYSDSGTLKEAEKILPRSFAYFRKHGLLE